MTTISATVASQLEIRPLVNNRLYGTDQSKICQATVGLIIQTMVSNIILLKKIIHYIHSNPNNIKIAN
jgi:hypothetical protein